MIVKRFARRAFLKYASVAVLNAQGVSSAWETPGPQAFPNSSGTEKPTLKAPPNAADCHVHIFDPQRFPPAPPGSGSQGFSEDTVENYRILQKRIGTTRVVIVTPRPYVTNNQCTVDALSQLGSNARGIAVIAPAVTDAELKQLDNAGIRGIRFNMRSKSMPVHSWDMVEPLANRVADLGWHIEINLAPEETLKYANILRRLNVPIVFDHMGNLGEDSPLQSGIKQPAFAVISELIDKGRAWVTLSGPYMNSRVGPPTYADAVSIAQALVKMAPERLVWGSDWPHPEFTAAGDKPDDATIFDLLMSWIPDKDVRNRILVNNPHDLYGFQS